MDFNLSHKIMIYLFCEYHEAGFLSKMKSIWAFCEQIFIDLIFRRYSVRCVQDLFKIFLVVTSHPMESTADLIFACSLV